MAVVRKKQDDKILKTLRELVSIGGNKECFDCGQKGPTYINMTIGSFVCTTCSGILRGITPPHRVKSISMATFTQEEIDFVRQNGNDACSRTWLGLWDPKRAIKQEHRDFMIDKYERKRYYLEPASPLKSLPTTNGTTASSTLASATNGNGSSTNINGSSSSNGSSKNAENLVPLKTITLTPPTSLRLSRTSSNSSGLNGNGNNSHTGSSTNLKFQQQFTPDDSNFFSDPPKILPPTPQKHSSNHHQRLNGGTTNSNGSTFERNQKNGLLTSTSTSNGNGINPANKFTPDTDFVADFSNANIIVNAATATTNGLKNGSNHRRLSNGFSENGNGGLIPNGHRNGNTSETENFADFEHNTIYNAAGLPISASTSSRSSSALSSATPSVDRYAALKDLDDQFREIKFESETNNNNHIISSSSASAAAAASVNGLSNGLMNGNHHHTNDVHQANPFKTANPFQQQAQQQQQQQTLSWAIPGSTPPATNGFYATSSTSPYQNGFVHPAGANMLNGNGVNGFTNAFHHQHQQQLHHHPSSNGGIQVTGAVPPYGHFGHFGNPFMAAGATTATSNSNNPFL